jgi:hypothetical protein
MLSENNNNNNNEGKTIERISGRIRSLVKLFNKEEGASVTISVDKESGVIRICNQEDTTVVKKASSALSEVLELSYATSEHHPYWGILYNATEISKTILDEWDSNLSKDAISEMSWRSDKIKVALEKIYEHNVHENS